MSVLLCIDKAHYIEL